MKNLPEHFMMPFGSHTVEITQVDRIDPHLVYEDHQLQNGIEDEIFIPGLFIAKSYEILICRNVPEATKHIILARCLEELVEYTFQESGTSRKEAVLN